MKRLFLTGSSGFFGINIQQALHKNYEFIPSYSSSLDITDARAVGKAITEAHPDYVVHAAAIASSQYCNDNPLECHQINVVGTQNIAKACKASGSRLIFLSTEQVFNGNSNSGPYNESDTPIPAGKYGESKYQAEEKIKELCLDYVILRLTWLFDYPKANYPRMLNNILINTIEDVKRGKSFTVPSNEFRGMTNIGDLMEHFPKLMDLPTGIYHTGSENPVDRHDIVQQILKDLGVSDEKMELLIKDASTYANKPRDIRLNTTKLRSHGIVFPSTPEAIRNAIRKWKSTKQVK